jgi:hypothetical protein
MISGRTKVLLFVASLPLLVCIGVAVWLTLAPYYDRLIGENHSGFFMFSFHFTPWSWIWVFVLVAGLISLLYDKVTIRK